MNITKTMCDNCQKEVTDPRAEMGWTVLYRPAIEIFSGAHPSTGAQGMLYSLNSATGHLDFCCIECFSKYLTKQAAKGKRRLTAEKNKKEKAKK